MRVKYNKDISAWHPVSELRPIDWDISEAEHRPLFNMLWKLRLRLLGRWIHDKSEWLDVARIDGKVCYCVHEDGLPYPSLFETQFGTFNNHNHGEQNSWLGKDGYDRRTDEKLRISLDVSGRKDKIMVDGECSDITDHFLWGNFCDMFDCGKFTYAVDNQTHGGLGRLRVFRIDGDMDTTAVYDNSSRLTTETMEYMGRYDNERGCVLLISGWGSDVGKAPDNEQTSLLQVDMDGHCEAIRHWNLYLSPANSRVADGDWIWLGNNRMVTRFNHETGEVAYFTNLGRMSVGRLRKD